MDGMQEHHCADVLEFAEKLLSSESADVCDDLRDLELLPRVGDEYQVEIPSLIAESRCLSLTNNPTDIPYSVLVGQPIPVMWIKEEVGNNKHEPLDALIDSIDASECNLGTQNFPEGCNLKPKVEPMNTTLERGMKLGESSNLDLHKRMKIEMHREKSYCPVPGSSGDTWSDFDEASFLLGLYIFGKNLVQVKKFVGSKTMGEILSFYYGTFYKSEKYCKWSECRRTKNRRCVYGQRIFTGLRQQELLSRLQCHVSEECQNTVLEDLKLFAEGKMSLEEYVFTLRTRVGLNALVEAVGIGKGKQDLTGMAMEPLKSNQVVTLRPEIPVGKAWSKLTSVEIINFLTGGYRLSKARSSDLFWEAVWPRLLARGWHSEEPNNHGCAAGSKHSLVFLIPGVKKFSRRKLVKGNHYFDSVSDVLSKVAAEPGLLELEAGAGKGDNFKEENGWTTETKLCKADFPDHQRHCYLKPRTPNRSVDVMRFTVVDTSLANGGTLKVRELRSLPVEMKNFPSCQSHSGGGKGDISEEPTDESDSSDSVYFDRDEQNGSRPTNRDFDRDDSFNKDALNGISSFCGPDLSNAPAIGISDQKNSKCNDTQPREVIKAQLNQRIKPDNDIHLALVTKRRRRLTACNRTETTNGAINGLMDHRLKQDEARSVAGNADSSENISSQVYPSQEKFSSTNSSRGSLLISGEGTLSSACSGTEHPCDEHPPRTVIDLNLPILPDSETDEPFMKEETEIQPDQTNRQPDASSQLKACAHLATSEQQPNMNSRRQSTRNRPLTTKALEALAFGFLNTKQKRRFGDAFPREHPLPSRRARGRVRVAENLDGGIIDLQEEERGDDLCNDNNDVLSELKV